MQRIVLIVLLVLAIPWAVSTWWRMRRARGPRERSFIGRSSLGVAMFTAMAALLLTFLKGHNLMIALPIIGVAGFALRHGLRKGRALAQSVDGDPVSRAKRVDAREL
jgi:hypothetical protein